MPNSVFMILHSWLGIKIKTAHSLTLNIQFQINLNFLFKYLSKQNKKAFTFFI